MNKADLVAAVAAKSGLTAKDSAKAIDAFGTAVEETPGKGDKVSLVGFGTFETKLRGEKKCRNLRTKEEIVVPATNVPAFKASKTLKDKVAK